MSKTAEGNKLKATLFEHCQKINQCSEIFTCKKHMYNKLSKMSTLNQNWKIINNYKNEHFFLIKLQYNH